MRFMTAEFELRHVSHVHATVKRDPCFRRNCSSHTVLMSTDINVRHLSSLTLRLFVARQRPKPRKAATTLATTDCSAKTSIELSSVTELSSIDVLALQSASEWGDQGVVKKSVIGEGTFSCAALTGYKVSSLTVSGTHIRDKGDIKSKMEG